MLAFLLASVVTLSAVEGGLIHHNDKATSYQTFSLEHYHAVPTYVKKEHAQFLDHPVSKGKVQSKVEIHHGDKHDPGYAITDIQNDHGYGEGYEVPQSHGELSLEGDHGIQYPIQDKQEYQVQDHQEGGENQSYGHFLELANAALAQAYQHHQH